MEAPSSVTVSLFLISTHFENLIHLGLTILKFKILAASFEAESSILIPPYFFRISFFP